MILVVYGPEGSGKGTQAKLLGERIGLPVYTAGDLVREAALEDKSSLGDMARKVLRQGLYLPDSQMCNLLLNKLKKIEAEKGFILDGFPRTLGQVKFLMKIFEEFGYQLTKVIYLSLPRGESIKRLLKRKRRLYRESNILHDDPKRIKQRLGIYLRQESELLPFFRGKNLLLEINANQSIKKVFDDILMGLNLNS